MHGGAAAWTKVLCQCTSRRSHRTRESRASALHARTGTECARRTCGGISTAARSEQPESFGSSLLDCDACLPMATSSSAPAWRANMSRMLSRRGPTLDPSNYQCQRCLQRGHFSYQCKGERVYRARASRTQEVR